MKTSKKASRKAATANEAPATTGTEATTSQVPEQDVPFAPEAATVGEQGAPKPPAKPASKKGTSKKSGAPKAKKGAKAAKAAAGKKTAKPATKKAAKARGAGPRGGSKTAQVVAMLQRKNGATLAEIMAKMGWQKHTVRGFMAGAMKKAAYKVESFKPEGGERTYRINS